MDERQISEVLARPYARQLLHGTDPVRLAYTGLDGGPRVVPVGFWTEGDDVMVATTPNAPKVAALRVDPRVALTIDTSDFPPTALLIRGVADLETVDGVPDGYLEGSRRLMTAEDYVEWEAGVRALYDEMVVIRVTPSWARLLDFETTVPQAVEELVRAKAAGAPGARG